MSLSTECAVVLLSFRYPSFIKLDRNTELHVARAVDVMMARAKRIYILMIKIDKLFSFFVAVFSKRNRKHVLCVSIELWKHSWKFGRTRKSCGNTRLSARVPTAFLVLPNFHSCFYLTIRLWARDFYRAIVYESSMSQPESTITEAQLGVLGIRDICEKNYRDTGYLEKR